MLCLDEHNRKSLEDIALIVHTKIATNEIKLRKKKLKNITGPPK